MKEGEQESSSHEQHDDGLLAQAIKSSEQRKAQEAVCKVEEQVSAVEVKRQPTIDLVCQNDSTRDFLSKYSILDNLIESKARFNHC